MKKVFEIKSDGKTIFFRWLEDGEHGTVLNKECAMVKLSSSLKPFLIGIERNFTAYELGYIVQLKRKYSITIYEYFKSQKGTDWHQHLSLNLDTCSEKFFDGKYKTYNDLNKMLPDVVDEINKFTDIKIKYEPKKMFPEKKTYCQIKGIEFDIYEKTNKEKFEVWKGLKFYPEELEKLKIVDKYGNPLPNVKKGKKGKNGKSMEPPRLTEEEIKNLDEKHLQDSF
jgi:plasmid replication initiation protein